MSDAAVGLGFVGAFVGAAVASNALRSPPVVKEPPSYLTKSALGTWAIEERREEIGKNATFSVQVPPPAVPTNQRSTGRCWLFAACNAARVATGGLEISPAFLAYYDYLEKAALFLSSIEQTRSEPLDGRVLAWLLDGANLINDGGQWDMVSNLLIKHGAVPTSAYGQAKAHTATLETKKALRVLLRAAALDIRATANLEQRMEKASATLERVRHILDVMFGKPPSSFEHQGETFTPQEFYGRLVQPHFEPNEFVCLVNCGDYQPLHSLLTVEHLGHLEAPVRYVTVPMPLLIELILKQLADGSAVWIGVDWGHFRDLSHGLLDVAVFARAREELGLKKVDDTLTKGDRLRCGESAMTHAITIVGYNEELRLFKVENSHGTRGIGGHYHMSVEWAQEWLIEAAILKKYISSDVLEILKKDPKQLPPWDPLGSLA